MKQRILIFCTVLISLGLLAFGISNWNDSERDVMASTMNELPVIHTVSKENIASVIPDFLFDVGPRFSPITKVKLSEATSISDFNRSSEIQTIQSLKSVNVVIIKNERNTNKSQIGYKQELNKSQLKLLKDLDYSSSFAIRTDFDKVNAENGAIESGYLNPYYTIVPEKQAEYVNGKYELLRYLRDKSLIAIADVQQNKVRPAKLFFTVTKDGNIKNVRIGNHSGYPEVDKLIIDLINTIPGSWVPAENSKGQKIDQELVISFGGIGC